MTAEEIKAAISAYYAAASAGDVDASAAMFAPDAVMHDPVGMPPATDDAQRRQRYAGIVAAFESFTIGASLVLVCGNEVAAHWAAGGRARNGKDVAFEGISTFAFDDAGKITRMDAYWEPAAIIAAMAG